jgi:hypothetical protein
MDLTNHSTIPRKPTPKIHHSFSYLLEYSRKPFLTVVENSATQKTMEDPDEGERGGRELRPSGASGADEDSQSESMQAPDCASDWGSASEAGEATGVNNSGDEDWEPASALFSSSDEEADGGGALRDSVAWRSENMKSRVEELLQGHQCESQCIAGKEADLQRFLLSTAQMNKEELKTSIYTALAILKEADVADRRRGECIRHRYAYYLPFVGRVCREAFCECYKSSTSTIKRIRAQIKGGSFAPQTHGGVNNKNASAIDVSWLVSWYKGLAAAIGEVVPVRIRKQTTINGKVHLHYSPVDYVLLPAHLTWDQLHGEMLRYVVANELSVREPARATMRQLLTKHCPTIRARSPRSNVCAVCTIYQSRMRGPVTTDVTEDFGKHTQAAKRMR